MREGHRPSVPLLVSALGCATAALMASSVDARLAAIATASSGMALLAVEFVRACIPQRRTDPALISRLVEQAQQGRKLAIYDRDTGLFAHWYLALRGHEECARAGRYGRGLSLLIIEPSAGTAGEEWAAKSRIREWIQSDLRLTDIAGYLGNGRYAVITPEVCSVATEKLIARLRETVHDADVGAAAFGADGESFDALWRVALGRLRATSTDAA